MAISTIQTTLPIRLTTSGTAWSPPYSNAVYDKVVDFVPTLDPSVVEAIERGLDSVGLKCLKEAVLAKVLEEYADIVNRNTRNR